MNKISIILLVVLLGLTFFNALMFAFGRFEVSQRALWDVYDLGSRYHFVGKLIHNMVIFQLTRQAQSIGDLFQLTHYVTDVPKSEQETAVLHGSNQPMLRGSDLDHKLWVGPQRKIYLKMLRMAVNYAEPMERSGVPAASTPYTEEEFKDRMELVLYRGLDIISQSYQNKEWVRDKTIEYVKIYEKNGNKLLEYELHLYNEILNFKE